jgi:SOS-response transcriptional repressor LexA
MDETEMDAGGHASSRRLPALTNGELRVLATLDDLTRELGYAPTFPQMLERLGWSPKSKSALHRYLARLRRHGVVAGAGRSLRIVR